MSNEKLPWWELPGAPGENRTKEQHEAHIAALKEPRPAPPNTPSLLTERLIQAAVDYETGRCSRRELSEARAAVEAAMGPSMTRPPSNHEAK